MKRLTINRLASAGIRANRRAYVSLAAGIFLAIFLISAVCLGIQGVSACEDEKLHSRMGYANAFLMDAGNTTDEKLQALGYFERIGHTYVTGYLTDKNKTLGYYDDEAAALLNRSLKEGRMPQAAGEIAMEQSAIETLRTSAQVGDTLELSITPVDGVAETRSFTLVGILNEQSIYQTVSMSTSWVKDMPAVLVCPEEPLFATGRVATCYVMRAVNDLVLYRMLDYDGAPEYENIQNMYGTFFAINGQGEAVMWPSGILEGSLDTLENALLLAVIGGALLLAACVAIAGAMEGQLARKTEEIALLRAVGATRRQIRRIFGRESWLLAAVVSPLAMGAACLAVWAAAKLVPQTLLFQPTWWVLVPIGAFSVLTIILSASLPLRRASRTAPLKTLRDTALMRKMRKVKTRRTFRATRLIASRQMRLKPTRLIGSSLLVCMMLFILGWAVPVALYIGDNVTAESVAFRLTKTSGSFYTAFTQQIPANSITTGDMSQLRALPMVKKIEETRRFQINLLVDPEKNTDYYDPDSTDYSSNYHLSTNRPSEYYASERQRHKDAQQALNTDKTLVQVELNAMILDEDELNRYLTAGSVDMAAIDAGQQVLVYAPDYYLEYYADGSTHISYKPSKAEGWSPDKVILNDFYTLGMELNMVQIWLADGDLSYSTGENFFLKDSTFIGDEITVTVGGLLSGEADKVLGYPWGPMILTSEQGAAAMGLQMVSPDYIDIYLDELPDTATEQALATRIETIGMRSGMLFDNMLEGRRETQAQNQRSLVVMFAVSAIFFAVAVGMISGNLGRQLQADIRMIGTLRAVGANERDILHCYTGQITANVCIGSLLGLLLILGLYAWNGMLRNYLNWTKAAPFITLGVLVGFAVLAWGCCMLILRRRIRSVTSRAIVENIREL